jgi:glycosyltransferase involved in cell wall biosynthesis
LTSDLPLSLARPIVLYLGNLASYKVDLALLERLARMRSDWSWVLVGPVGRGDPETSLESLLALPQVHYLGEVSRDEAPAYVAASDVCLLPLRRTRSTEGSAPLKIYEYLAAGRPVVSTPIPAVAELARKGIVRIAVQDAEWISAIEQSLRDGEDGEERRHDEAMSHGWEARIDEIERFLFS